MKFLTFTTEASEILSMISLLRNLYYSRRFEGISVVLREEWKVSFNPLVHRFYHEYSLEPCPAEHRVKALEQWLGRAARRALWEERPELIFIPRQTGFYADLLPLCHRLGVKVVLCVSPTEVGEVCKNGVRADAVYIEGAGNFGFIEGTPLLSEFGHLLKWVSSQVYDRRADRREREIWQDLVGLIDIYWAGIKDTVPSGVCGVWGPEIVVNYIVDKERERFVEVKRLEAAQGKPLLSIFGLGIETEDGGGPCSLLRKFRAICPWIGVVEPVNLPLGVGKHLTFCYGDYDNEFALGKADFDLLDILREVFPDLPWHSEVLSVRSGAATSQVGSTADKKMLAPALEAPDGTPSLIFCRIGREIRKLAWWERFNSDPEGAPLKIVFLDSQNIAASVLNHSAAVNLYTPHTAWAVCLRPHPFIEVPSDKCQPLYLDRVPMEVVQRVLEDADCLVFFEDDDEESAAWPFDLRPYARDKAVLHIYIGYRVHTDILRLQRPQRLLLTPLPHIMRMYPRAYFYAGFPPVELESRPLRPPLSESDGIIRILHTPSLPHPALCRYYYHKDTELFIEAARLLSGRYGERVEFWQLAGIPHRMVLKARQDCDVTFNQLRGYHGLSGDEAMFLGRPVVQAFDQFNINRHREYWGLDVEFPWVTATRNNLADVFGSLIDDADLRNSLGVKSRKFMLEYFSPRVGILPLIYYCRKALLSLGKG